MKKVLVIFPKDSESMFNTLSTRTFGGATVQMYLFAKYMKKKEGLDVYSFICDYANIDFDEADDFTLVKSYNEADNLVAKAFKTHKAISGIRPDIIIQHGLTNESCLLALYCFIRKIKFVFMFAHDVEVKRRFQSSGKKCYLYGLLMKFSHLLVVQNKYQLDELKNAYGEYINRTILLYNGFPLKKLKEKRSRNILWVARSDEWKKPELFIRLASLHPGFKFTMICPNSGDDIFYDKIVALAGGVKNLEFIPFVPFSQIDQYFEKAFLFVNTSDHEGYPQTFIQAVMNGVPILSLNVNPDCFITSFGCGEVFNGDFERMGRELGRIMKDSSLYNKLSGKAYNYFLQKHNIEKNIDELFGKLYSSF